MTKGKRVWINEPSTLQPDHQYHGQTGIAIPDTNGYATVYFTEGEVVSVRIHSRYLADGRAPSRGELRP